MKTIVAIFSLFPLIVLGGVSTGPSTVTPAQLAAAGVVTNLSVTYTNSLVVIYNTNNLVFTTSGSFSQQSLIWNATIGAYTNASYVAGVVDDGGLFFEIGTPPFSTLAGRSLYYSGQTNVLLIASTSWTQDGGTLPVPTAFLSTNAVPSATTYFAKTNLVTYSNSCVYVDPVSGSDFSGIRGYSDRPFVSLQTALKYAQDGDTVFLNSGTYNAVSEATDLPDAFSLNGDQINVYKQVKIVGAGAGNTIYPHLIGIRTNNITLENLTCRTISVNLNGPAVITNIFLNNIRSIGFNDGYYSSGPAVVVANNCYFSSGWDAGVNFASPTLFTSQQMAQNNLTFNHCEFVVDYRLQGAVPPSTQTRAFCYGIGTQTFNGCGFINISSNSSVPAVCFYDAVGFGLASTNTGTMIVNGGYFSATNYGAGTSLIIGEASGYATALLSGVFVNPSQIYDPSNKVSVVSPVPASQLTGAVPAIAYPTNTASFGFVTNQYSLNTYYTNFNQRAWLRGNFTLTPSAADSAQVTLFIDEDGNGSWEETDNTIKAGAGASVASVAEIYCLSDMLNPNARFVFTNQSSGTATATILSSKLVKQ